MNILDRIKEEVENQIKGHSDLIESLKQRKIIISIIEGPKVIVKTFRVGLRSAKKHKDVLPKEVKDRVVIVKKALKINTDVNYLLTLIGDVKNCVNKLDYKHITNEAAEQIKSELTSLDKLLNKATLKLEHLPPSKETV